MQSDVEVVRQSIEALASAAHQLQISLHPQMAELGSHLLNFVNSLADAGLVASDSVATAATAAADVSDVVTSAVTDSAANAATSSTSGGGPFDIVVDIFDAFLKLLDDVLEGLGIPYSYGYAIILLTIIVKVGTFPLTKQQVESSLNMQALQPKMKEIQDTYKDDPEMLQQKTAALYQEAGVNPLAGCLPTLATLPVFIGLYRSITRAADQGALSDGFYFIPSLAGPTTISERQAGMGLSWLFPFENGAPPVGWTEAGLYLILPAILVLTQFISQKIISPPPARSDDQSAQMTQSILKFLPLLLGWFSLNVPSGLTLYWVTNNVLSTAQQVYLKRVSKPSAIIEPQGTIVKPRATEVIDVEARQTGKELGARRSSRKAEVKIEPLTKTQAPPRGAKFRARKAKEAARKAARIAKQASAKVQESSNTVTSSEAPPLNLGSAPDLTMPGLKSQPDGPAVETSAVSEGPDRVPLKQASLTVGSEQVDETVEHTVGVPEMEIRGGPEAAVAPDVSTTGVPERSIISEVEASDLSTAGESAISTAGGIEAVVTPDVQNAEVEVSTASEVEAATANDLSKAKEPEVSTIGDTEAGATSQLSMSDRGSQLNEEEEESDDDREVAMATKLEEQPGVAAVASAAADKSGKRRKKKKVKGKKH